MSFDYQSYLLGKHSAERLVKTIEEILCCSGDEECSFALAKAAPYLLQESGRRDCERIDRLLNLFFAWYGVRWVAQPCGEDPDTKQEIMREILCSGSMPVDEEFLRRIGQRESDLSPGEDFE